MNDVGRLQIQVLDFDQPNDMTMAALDLLWCEIAGHIEDDSQASWTKKHLEDGKKTYRSHYGITEAGKGIIAVADTVHWDDEGLTNIYSLAVEPARQGKGVGTLLMKYIAAEALTRGDTRIELYSLANDFYKKLGFVAVDPQEDASDLTAAPADILKS